ncbi:hypothetical protein GCM10010266_31690 [Streptomyces griseomycini]|uniref:Uncharacterized protein n=1 Tax=Streptomyces griseomycini TaxID=66895 RepID=A0A7W7LZ19_9ACTN|nr:hypothetical protein [Streptomyces griseomycini]MBB4899109.1 hypothetical protein [Streptomyces griseomycini]GGQ05933.1 hypothetical protein GCM10010266_31690 [Streptomyces griseomycini]GGR21275.1 hypothetical protein GCM10015536_28630 [Streptomyces griseomycini]
MESDRKHRAARSSTHVCRSCKQPVDTVVERHKTMGVYVPVWTAGPCHNPQCERCRPEEAPLRPARGATRYEPDGRKEPATDTPGRQGGEERTGRPT